jgi:DNA-binding PadR family transcriptional regulator
MKSMDFGIPNLTRSCNETLILSLLYKGRKHGYQLALEIEEKSKRMFALQHGTLYPILHKLEKENLIRGTWKPEGPRRKRKYYTITARGRKYAQAQLTAWKEFTEVFFQITGEIQS